MLVQVGRQIRDEQGELVRELAVEPNWDREDHVALLARETIDAGKSVLIFCASKKVQSPSPSPVPPANRPQPMLHSFQHIAAKNLRVGP